MNAFVGVTDESWFRFLASRPGLEEVNFWQPGGNQIFRSLDPGGLFLFKLRMPRNAIVGGGFFAHSTLLPVSLAWEAFREANGASSLSEMRRLIERLRKTPAQPHEDYRIGCVLLEQPFFLPEDLWIPAPADWARNIVRGKRYDPSTEQGRILLERVQTAIQASGVDSPWPAAWRDAPEQRYGEPTLVRPRLGQGSFRILVTDAYQRSCAVTGERVLPVLEAAHIRPYGEGGEHRVENGLLLRSDLHTLFDRGYMTVTPELQLEVSRRIREDFQNGRHYYALHGSEVRPPRQPEQRPSEAFLRWHNEQTFLG